MPVYVNTIFNNRTESEKNVCIIVSEKMQMQKMKLKGLSLRLGTEYPKIFILCESEPGFQVDLRNKQWLKRSEYSMKKHQGFSDSMASECIFIQKLSLKRNKSSSRYLFTFIWQPLPKSGPEYKYPCLHHHHLTIRHSGHMTITTSRRKLKAH